MVRLLFTKAGEEPNELATPEEKGYLKDENNYMVVKVCVLLYFLSFGKFMIVNLLCAFVAFLGSWRLFLFFRTQHPHLEKSFALACMGIPSVIFWSSGISKDAICMASLGFLTWSLYNIMLKNNKIISNLIVVVLCSLLMFFVKPYILFSYLPFFMYFLVAQKIKNISNSLTKALYVLFIPVLLLVSSLLCIY